MSAPVEVRGGPLVGRQAGQGLNGNDPDSIKVAAELRTTGILFAGGITARANGNCFLLVVTAAAMLQIVMISA